MPRNPLAARRYARALGLLGDSKIDLVAAQSILQEMRAFQAVLNSSRQTRQFFASPVISKSAKKETLQEIKDQLPHTFRFLSMLIESNRFGLFNEILEEVERGMEALSGELSVTIESARTLSEEILAEIKSTLQERWGKKIRAKTQINPDLIGGFVARAPGKIFDASVKHQFEVLKQSLGA